MPQIITFVSPKGGSGSTFICAGVWHSLVKKSKKVLALDMSFEDCSLDFALGFQSDYIYTMSDVCQDMCTLSEAVCSFGSGSFVRCDYEQQDADVAHVMEIVKASDYDYVLVDLSCHCHMAELVLKETDSLVVVCHALENAVRRTELWLDKYAVENTYVVINKIIPAYIQSKIHLTADEVLDALCVKPLGFVPWSPWADVALKQGMRWGPEDEALESAFSNISSRIMGEYVPADEFKDIYKCFKLSKKFAVKND